MRKYELLLVLPGTLDENEAEVRSAQILDLIKEKDEKAHIDVLGKNRLAYPIKLIRYGYFYTIVFSVEPEDLLYIQNKLSLERDLLRSIISLFNVKVGANKKITYSIGGSIEENQDREEKENVSGYQKKEFVKIKKEKILPVAETTESVKEIAVEPVKKVDMDDINKKLDEILDGDIKLDV